MDKVNVLLIGNSGVGKSTLINAVLENKVAKTSIGERGTVKMDVYESDSVPFRLIDSKGMEYSFFENFKLKSELKKWTKTSLGNEDYEKCISMIWYCVDGTSKRLMKENLKILNSITKFFKSVPVIIVITKSYSQPERKENIEMISNALSKYEKSINLKDIIPVVAEAYTIREDTVIEPDSIVDLIENTSEMIPDLEKGTSDAITNYKNVLLNRQIDAYISACVASAVTVGAVPIPFADTPVLILIQTSMMVGIGKMYKIDGSLKDVAKILASEIGVSSLAKSSISLLKPFIPATVVLNAIVAGLYTYFIGQGAKMISKKIKDGELSIDDIDSIRNIFESFVEGNNSKAMGYLKTIENISNIQPSQVKDIVFKAIGNTK